MEFTPESIADMSFVEFYDMMNELDLQSAHSVKGILGYLETDLNILFVKYSNNFGETAQEVADNISRLISVGVKLELIKQKKLFTDKLLYERMPDCFKK